MLKTIILRVVVKHFVNSQSTREFLSSQMGLQMRIQKYYI